MLFRGTARAFHVIRSMEIDWPPADNKQGGTGYTRAALR